MSELRDLYQEVILDHVKRPRNFGALVGASRRADGDNPLCGDKVTVFISIEDGRVTGIKGHSRGGSTVTEAESETSLPELCARFMAAPRIETISSFIESRLSFNVDRLGRNRVVATARAGGDKDRFAAGCGSHLSCRDKEIRRG